MSNFKIQGVLAFCLPFRRPWGHWRIEKKISLKNAPTRLAPSKVFGMPEWFWYAWVILARLSSFDMREWFWHAWKLLTCKSDFGWKRQTSSAKWYRKLPTSEPSSLHRFLAEVIDVWNDNKQIKRHCSITSFIAQSVCCQLTSKTPLALTCWWSFRDYSEVRNCSSE